MSQTSVNTEINKFLFGKHVHKNGLNIKIAKKIRFGKAFWRQVHLSFKKNRKTLFKATNPPTIVQPSANIFLVQFSGLFK